MTWKPIAFFSAHLVLAAGWMLAISGAIIGGTILMVGMANGSLKHGLLLGLIYLGLIGGPGIAFIAFGRFTREHTRPPADDAPVRQMRRGADVFWVGLILLTMVLIGTAWKTLQGFEIIR